MIGEWYDDFFAKVMFVLTTRFLPIGFMIIGHGTIYWVWCYLVAIVLMITGEYLR